MGFGDTADDGGVVDIQNKVVSEEEVALVREILKALVKTIKTFTVYPKGNPIYEKFAAEMSEKFAAFFGRTDILSLEVEQNSLSYKGHTVFESEDRHSNFSLILYVDGIRQISFHEGLSEEELVSFIDILRIGPKDDNLDDDVVTLLWDKDLPHISYFVPEEVGEFEMGIEEDLEGVVVEFPSASPSATEAGGAGAKASETASASPIGPGGGGSAAETSASSGAVPGTGLGRLREESEGLRGDALLTATLSLFFELMSAEQDAERFADLARNIGRAISILAEGGDVGGIIKVLRLLRKLADASEDERSRRAIGEAGEMAGSLETMKMLFSGGSDPEMLAEYISLLGKDAVVNVIEILGQSEDRNTRKNLCDALVPFASKDVTPFINALDDARWFLVRNLVLVLGRSKNPDALRPLERSLRHRERRVRNSVIRGLEHLGSKQAVSVLAGLLSDEDRTVRMNALRAMKNADPDTLYPYLLDKVLRADFGRLEFDEKRAALEALGEIGREDALPYLKRLLTKLPIFRRTEVNETRACAAYGLGFVGGETARALLESGTKARTDLVRAACRESLKRFKKNA